MDLEPVDKEPTHQIPNNAATKANKGAIDMPEDLKKSTVEQVKQLNPEGKGSLRTGDSTRGSSDGEVEDSTAVKPAGSHFIQGSNNAGLEADSRESERSGPEVKKQGEKQNFCQAAASVESNATASGVCEKDSANKPNVEAADGQPTDQSPNIDGIKSSSTELESKETESKATYDGNPVSPDVRNSENLEVGAADGPNPGDSQIEDLVHGEGEPRDEDKTFVVSGKSSASDELPAIINNVQNIDPKNQAAEDQMEVLPTSTQSSDHENERLPVLPTNTELCRDNGQGNTSRSPRQDEVVDPEGSSNMASSKARLEDNKVETREGEDVELLARKSDEGIGNGDVFQSHVDRDNNTENSSKCSEVQTMQKEPEASVEQEHLEQQLDIDSDKIMDDRAAEQGRDECNSVRHSGTRNDDQVPKPTGKAQGEGEEARALTPDDRVAQDSTQDDSAREQSGPVTPESKNLDSDRDIHMLDVPLDPSQAPDIESTSTKRTGSESCDPEVALKPATQTMPVDEQGFGHVAELSDSCPWCNDFAYGLVGFQPTDKQPDMCGRFAQQRASIKGCQGHHPVPLDGVDPETFDSKAAFNTLTSVFGEPIQKNQWCSLCPAPAFFVCKTQGTAEGERHGQGQSSACGLLLCEACKILVRAFQDLGLVVARNKADGPVDGARADVGFLLPGGICS
ncbi:hypothetical protein BDV19DRAFT_293179 [Aspergillus venezuelensis]